MTDPAASVPGPEARASWADGPRRALPVALRNGASVALAAIVMGQVVVLVIDLAGGGLAVATQLRLGWLYTAASNAVPIRIGQLAVEGGQLEPFGTTTLAAALLTLTAVLMWLLFAAGRVVARRVGDAPVRRALAGALVAPAYAAPLAVLGLVVELRLSTGGGFFPDVSTFRAAPVAIVVLPFVLAAAAGGAGGLKTSSWFDRAGGSILAGAWRMFVWALGLSLVGLLMFAAARPSGLEGYSNELGSLGPRTAATVVGHQGLLLPNQATVVLVVAMGGCGTVTSGAVSFDALCLDRQPEGENPLQWISGGLASPPRLPTRPMPSIARLLALAPLAAVVIGARRAATRASSMGSAVVRGVLAGLVFGALVAIAAWAGAITLSSTQERGGVVEDSGSVSVGTRPLEAGAFAAAWGVGVGAATAVAVSILERRPRSG